MRIKIFLEDGTLIEFSKVSYINYSDNSIYVINNIGDIFSIDFNKIADVKIWSE